MFPAKFEYASPTSLNEVLTLLQQGNGDAKILAGGHSLLPLMKLRLAQPRLLIDIGRIPDLRYIRVEGDELVIGALATYRDLTQSEDVHRALPVLAEAASEVGDVQVRARGTLAGALAHADPAADMPAVVLAVGGSVHAVGASGERDYALDDFFVDMLTTQLDEHEVITQVRLKVPASGTGSAYEKFDQPASHYALCGVCAVIGLGSDGKIASARLGVTGVGTRAYRPSGVEKALVGIAASDDNAVRGAVQSAAEGVDVQGDIHASPDYRAHLARVLTRRAVVAAAGQAGK
ncbi:MAG: xanthine dehydrogenase family protein subunit M [Chloroflexi bacterium]|nr:xanthine dehydrogenase family protein subunit M [Chloroflexota bacterium]